MTADPLTAPAYRVAIDDARLAIRRAESALAASIETGLPLQHLDAARRAMAELGGARAAVELITGTQK